MAKCWIRFNSTRVSLTEPSFACGPGRQQRRGLALPQMPTLHTLLIGERISEPSPEAAEALWLSGRLSKPSETPQTEERHRAHSDILSFFLSFFFF